MYRNLLGLSVLLAALLVLATGADGNQAGDEGWVQLFNGKDLTGWKIHPKPNSRDILEVITMMDLKAGKTSAYNGKLTDGKTVPLWRVEEGMLIGSGPASHLFSER